MVFEATTPAFAGGRGREAGSPEEAEPDDPPFLRVDRQLVECRPALLGDARVPSEERLDRVDPVGSVPVRRRVGFELLD
ncbi:hypothetical protein [Halolamina pelagica]|uniref:hypothetical protein n=1 Tax=Halolamina pelagica TaxID=699431 RepID=UPI0006CA9252|nr:hypothetical protein [Halolamina pelagica]